MQMFILISNTKRSATATGLELSKEWPFATHLKWESGTALPYATMLVCKVLMSLEMWHCEAIKPASSDGFLHYSNQETTDIGLNKPTG